MNELVRFNQVEEKIIKLRNQNVILDCDVAELYGVETKEVNQAVKNNPKKFPKGYVIELKRSEFHDVRSKFLTSNLEKTRVLPKVFTEKGCYMLATILKGEKATQTTIDIIEAYAKIRELSNIVAQLSESPEASKHKSLMQRSGDIIAEILSDDMKVTDSETSIEINFALMKFKHTIKRKKNDP
jgi:phage regulator Rha-like protein